MRSILLHIHNDPCLEARLQVSLDLARSFGAHITCMQVTPLDFIVPGDFYGTMAAEIVPVLRKNAGDLREAISSRLEKEDVSWDWRQEDGLALDYLLQAGALNDVVVVGACDPITQGDDPSRLAGTLAIKARTPVLVVPSGARSLDVSGSALVAWNGSLEAAHALRAALPLLARSRSVVLATVAEEISDNDELSATEAAQYLSRHGVECEIAEFPPNEDCAEVLRRAAAAREASCIVMGAYGHSRFVETVFGGVTRELLADPPLPLLAAH